MTYFFRFVSKVLVGVLTFTLVPVVGNSENLLASAQATATVSCGNTSAGLDFGDFKIRPVHGTGFYSDVRNGINAGYAGFEITNDTATAIDNLWLGINNFRSGASGSVLSMANPNESIQPLGRIASGSTGYVYFLIKSSNVSESTQQQDLTIYSGNPNAGGTAYATAGTYASGYKCINSFSKVKRTLAASANKVTQITASSNYKVGDTVTITVRGALGTVGAGDSGLDGKSMIVSPASNASWPSQLLRLESLQTTVYSNKNYGGTTKTTSNQIKISETQLTVAAKIAPVYISTYTYRILGASSQSAEIKPIADIASGTQMKHTGKYPSTSTYVLLNQVSRDVLIKKSVDTSYSINKSGSSYLIRYKITIQNSGSQDVKVDELVDLPASGATLVSGTVQVKDKNRTSFANLSPAPSGKDANGYYRFSGPFTAGPMSGSTPGTAELIYVMNLPIPASGSVSYSNKAIGYIGSTVIGSSETAATATDCSLSISSDSTYTSPSCNDNADIPKQSQTITFNQPPAQGAGTTYELDATSDSGLPITYSVRSGPCVISGNTITYQSEGSCVIVASQPGDEYYSPATNVIRSVTVYPAQFITFTNPTFASVVSMNTSATRDIEVTASSGLPVTLTAFDTTICKIGSTGGSTPAASYTPPQGTNSFRITSYATTEQCILTATQAGGTNASTSLTYGEASPVENTIFVGLKTQVLSTYGSAPTDQANTSATPIWSVQSKEGSTVINWTDVNPIDFTSITPQVCLAGDAVLDATSGNNIISWKSTLTLVTNGLCIIEANHDGDATYGPAEPIRTSFNIGLVPTVTITTTQDSASISEVKSNTTFQAEVVVTKPGNASASNTEPLGQVTLYASGDTSSSATQVGTVSTKVSGSSSRYLFNVNASILAALVPTGNISLFATFTSIPTTANNQYADSQTASSSEIAVFSPALVTIARSDTSRFPGQTATITVTVSGNSAYGAPVGNVTLSINDGGSITDPASSPYSKALSGGSATFTVTAGSDVAKDIVVDASYVPTTGTTSGTSRYFSTVSNSSTTLANRTIDIQERTYSYTVKYFANGGSGTIGDQTGTGANVQLRSNSFTRTGYVFAGWATTSTGSVTYTDGQVVTLSGDTTLDLYAIWTPIYTINFDANGGIGSPSIGSVSGQSGSTVTLASKGSLVKSGYVFSGWTRNSDGTGTSYTESESGVILSSSFTLYAKWTVQLYDYTITFNCNVTPTSDCSNPTAMTSQSGTNSSSVTLNANLYTRSGYLFAGWATSPNGTIIYLNQEQITFTSNLSLNLYAVWQPIPRLYTVTFNPNGATGTASVESVSQTSENQSLTLASIGSMVRTGYKFTGWNTNPDGTGSSYNAASSYTPTTNVTLYAVWEIVYTVTFNSNGGTGSPSVSSVTQTSSGLAVTLASVGTLVRTNYVFDGWNTKADGTGTSLSASASYTPTNNITLYAEWRLVVFTYSVTYYPNLGTGNSFTETGTGATKTLTANQFTRTGYVFRNWNTQSDGNGLRNYTNQEVVTLSADTTLNLYAIWDPVYTVTFDVNGATGSPSISSATQTALGGNVSLAERGTMAISGYSFGGWSTTVVGDAPIYSAGSSYTPTNNITLYAVWNPSDYNVTFNSNGGSSVDSKTFKTGGSVSEPTAPTKTGYTFNGWYTELTGGSLVEFPYSPGVSADVILYAQWTANTLTISYSGGTGSTGSAPTSPLSVSYGSTFTTPSNTYSKTGHTFAGWSDGTNTYAAGATYPSSGTVSGNVTLTATWTANTLTISYSGGTGSTGSAPTSPLSVSYGSTFTTPSNTYSKTGHTFAGWSDGTNTYAAGATYPSSGTVSGNVTLTATWTANTLTISYSGGTGSTGSAPTSPLSVSYGSTFTTPSNTYSKTGHTFAGWSDGTNTYAAGATYPSSGTVSGNVTLTATWTANTLTISYSGGTGSTGSAPTSPLSVSYGSTFTTPSNTYSKTGHTFAGWSDGTNTYAAGATYPSSGTVSGNVTLTATWTANTLTISYSGGTGSTGSAPTSPLSVSYGSTFTTPSNTYSKTGHTFAGWSDGTNTYAAGATYPSSGTVSGNVTLTATWTANTLTISYSGGTGSTGSAPTSPLSVSYGSTFTTPSNTYSKTGHTFAGWSDGTNTYAAGATYPSSGTVSGNVTLTATWTANTLTISYSGGTGSTGSAPTSPLSVSYGSTFTTPSNTYSKTGHTFAGWSDGTNTYAAGATYPSSGTVSGNVTLTATWTANTLTISYSGGTGSTGSAPTSPLSVSYGSTFTTPSNTYSKTGHTFAGWSDGTNTYAAGATYPSSGTVSGNVTLTATWTANTLTISYSGGTGSTGSAPTSPLSVSYGSTFTTPSNTYSKTGHTFAGWSDGTNTYAAGATYPSSGTVSGNVTLTATWTLANYSITYYAGGATGSVPTQTGKNYGEKFNLATSGDLTKIGYKFSGWSDGLATYNSESEYTVGANNVSLTAQWTAITYSVSFNCNVSSGTACTNPSAMATQSGSGVAAFNLNNNLYTRTGYTFAGWSTSPTGSVVYSNQQQVTFTDDLTLALYAQWTLEIEYEYTITFNANGGTGSMSQITGRTSNLTLPANDFSSRNFTFVGWSTTPTGSRVYVNRDTIQLENNLTITLYAMWQANSNGSNNSGGGGNSNSNASNSSSNTVQPTPTRNPTRTPTPRPSPIVVQPSPSVAQPSPSPAPSVAAKPQVPNYTIDLGRGTQSIPESVVEKLGNQASDSFAVIKEPEVKAEIQTNSDLGLLTKSLSQLGREKFKDISSSNGVYLEVVGARTTGQFIVSPTSISDPLTVLAALKESIGRNKTDFAWIEKAQIIPNSNSNSLRITSTREQVDSVFAQSKLDSPKFLSQITSTNNGNWIAITAKVESYKPGSEVYLVVTSSPIIFGSAIVGKDGKVEIKGGLPLEILDGGAHSIRIVGTRSISGAAVSADGEIKLTTEALTEVRRFDLGTQATVTIVGDNKSGGKHLVIREIPLEIPVPWWTIILLMWTSILFTALSAWAKIETRSEKILASLITGIAVLPSLWFGWTSYAYFIMGIGPVLGAFGIASIWFIPRIFGSKKNRIYSKLSLAT